MAGVVEELILRRRPVDVLVFLGAAVEHAGIAAGSQLPVERELEVAELVAADEVAGTGGLGEHAVGHAPGGRDGVALIAAPGGQAAIGKEGPPAVVRRHLAALSTGR